jgi:hypothetical protein
MPIGQFGTRNLGGKDAASARYIHTNLNKITRYLFKEEDGKIKERKKKKYYFFMYITKYFLFKYKGFFFEKNLKDN